MNNPSAFPRSLYVGSHHVGDEVGMTLRDYFAAKAFPAIWKHLVESLDKQGVQLESGLSSCDLAAKVSFEVADSMLKAREA